MSASNGRQPRFRATVKKLARDETLMAHFHNPNPSQFPDNNLNNRNQITSTIRGCLERGNHPNANEHEAKTAIRMAYRLMAKHNITQADLMQSVPERARVQFSGSSVVSISNNFSDVRLVEESWVGTVARAMQLFFDCKSYSERMDTTVDWTFYGIAQNTIAAALAFEMVYNKIALWSWELVGVSKRFSYCCGVSDGLVEMARDEKKREARTTEKKERRHQGHHRGLFSSDNETSWEQEQQFNTECSDDEKIDFDIREDQEIQVNNDVHDEIRRHMQQRQQPPPVRPSANSYWDSLKNLVLFRQDAMKIADHWALENDVKLYSGRKRTRVADKEAYAQGQADSKRIDVRQQFLQ